MVTYNYNLSLTEKLTIFTSLARMLAGGIPISQALDALLEDANNNQKRILDVLKADLAEGKNISESLEKFPKTFDPVITNLIRTAEKSGHLEKTLDEIVKTYSKESELKDKIKAAIAYPVFVIFTFLAIITLILLFVIPRITTVFLRLKQNLPLPTKILITISTQLRENTLIFLLGLAAVLAVLVFLFTKKKSLLLEIASKLPLVSNIATEVDLTRMSSSIALMLSSSIPLTEALNLSKKSVSQKNTKAAIAFCQETVESGKKFSEGLKKYPKIIPPIMIRMVEAGEKSGSLQKSLEELASYFDTKVDSSLKTLTILLEPSLLVIIGILVGGIMLAVIAPIYGLISQISNR